MILDIPIMPKTAFGPDGAFSRRAKFVRKPTGAGAFRLDRRLGNEVILRANEHFHSPDSAQAGAVLSEVRMTAFSDPTTARTRLENGQLDLLTSLHPADVLRLQASGRFRIKHFAMNQVNFIAFNHRRDQLTGPRGFFLRKGINLAIDRARLLREHYQARRGVRSAHRLLSGPFPRGSWAYDEDVKGYDFKPALARQTIRQSSAKDLTLRFIHPPDPIITAICSVMKKQIQDAGVDIGLKVRLVKLTPALFAKAIERRAFDLAYCSYTFDRPVLDLEQLLGDSEAGPGGRNYMGYRSPDLARLFDQLRLTDLWTKVRAINHEIHRHLYEGAVIVPLWQLDSYFASSLRVKELELHPVHLFGSPWTMRLK